MVMRISSLDNININNHFKVAAGPGSGKTTFLINHINNIIENSDKISNYRKICCITYTNVAVDNILKNLNNSIQYVEVSTIHSFLYTHIIKPYLWSISQKYNIDIANLQEDNNFFSKSLLRKYIKITNQTYVRESHKNFNIIRDVLSTLTWKLDKKSNKDTIKPIKNQKVEVQSGELRFLKNASFIPFKELCWQRGLISFDDVLYFSYKILTEYPKVAEIIRAKFPFILIDEFQDTSPIQCEIIKIIMQKETIVGVVGDRCQSIYRFQGSDVKQFETFSCIGMKHYYIPQNHRSCKRIVSFLNYIRGAKEEYQIPFLSEEGNSPKILVGKPLCAMKKCLEQHNSNNLYILTYTNDTVAFLRHNNEDEENYKINGILTNCDERLQIVKYAITAIEKAKKNNLKEALKYIKKVYKDINDERLPIIQLKNFINNYNTIKSLSITDFYNNHINIPPKITSGKIKETYDSIRYIDIAFLVNNNINNIKTIHNAKGDGYENVLVVIDENKNLDFLLNPDMTNEIHRLYYVAFSRAIKNLYINIPNIDEITTQLLNEKNLFDLEIL